jgi:hypothetical protein
VQIDVQVHNTKSSQEAWSSLLQFKLLDSTNRSYTEALVSTQPGPPDGQVAGGESLRGYVTYEVPTTAAGLVLQVQGSFTAGGAKFKLS